MIIAKFLCITLFLILFTTYTPNYKSKNKSLIFPIKNIEIVNNKVIDSNTLAKQLDNWKMDGRDVSLLIGGPEGLAPECIAVSEQKWSLSALTLPHPLVRIILSESLYRAWSVTQNHPYHRE